MTDAKDHIKEYVDSGDWLKKYNWQDKEKGEPLLYEWLVIKSKWLSDKWEWIDIKKHDGYSYLFMEIAK